MKRERSTSTVLTAHHSTVWCVSVDWDNQPALSGSGDCTLRLWDIQQRSTVRVLRGHKSIVWCLAVNWEPQHRMAVSRADDHTIRLWDLDRGKCLHVIKGFLAGVEPLRRVDLQVLAVILTCAVAYPPARHWGDS